MESPVTSSPSSASVTHAHCGDPPRISIIVLNWNGKQDTLECLASVAKINYPNYETIVVDNGSADDSVPTIRRLFPALQLIETAKNLGFAEGNNVGIRRALAANSAYVLLLNNDTTVDAEILNAFVDAARAHPAGGLFGAKIYFYSDPNRLWYAGGDWDSKHLRFLQIGDGELDCGQHDNLVETRFVIGCAMFISATVLDRVGLLEKDYFLNYEEIDFCSRVQHAGFGVFYVPSAKLWHKISASFGGEDSPLKVYFTYRNRLLWAKRNVALGLRLRIHAAVYAVLIASVRRALSDSGDSGIADGSVRYDQRIKNLWWRLRGIRRSPYMRAWGLGIRDYWLGHFGECPAALWELQREWKAMNKG